MILHIYYVKDSDEDMYLCVPKKPGAIPTKGSMQWHANNMEWYRVVNGSITTSILNQLINLSELPEPSWEDEAPMEILINLTVNNITYMYED